MKSPPKQEIQAAFRIVGRDVVPEEVTSTLGIDPSSSYAKGSPVPQHPNRLYPYGYWGIDSRVALDKPLEEHLWRLVRQLQGKRAAIASVLKQGFDVGFYCGIYSSDDWDGAIKLSPEILSEIATLGVPLDCRIYGGSRRQRGQADNNA
jgi:hypothetical protein